MDLWYALGTARGTVRVCGVHVWVTCESVCVTRGALYRDMRHRP